MIGKSVGRYKIINKLGEGGIGTVWKAEDTTLGRIVALKFLSSDIPDDEERARFLREARAASALDHPGICTIYEAEEDEDGRPYLAMAYCEGESLRERIAQSPLPLDEALSITVQIGKALARAHEKGIVHRDIKPANLLFGSEGTIKITDFGLAAYQGATRLTKTGTSMGTVAYASPEQLTGQDVDRRADLWSLGVVLYEMLVGEVPFSAEHEQGMVHKILSEDPEPITARRAGVPLELDRILSKALATDPGERYQHVEDMLVDLRLLGQAEAKDVIPRISPERSARAKKFLWTMATIGMLVVATTMVMLTGKDSSNLGSLRLVVLPFENMTGDQTLDFLRYQAAEEISDSVARAQFMDTVSFSDVAQIIQGIDEFGTVEEQTNSLQVVVDEFQAGIAITATIYPINPQTIEFRVQIRDMRSGGYHSLEPLRFGTANRSSLLERLREAVVGELAVQMDQEQRTWADLFSPPRSLEAYSEFHEGRRLYFQYERREAIRHLYLASKMDTTYLAPLLLAARIHYILDTATDDPKADSLLTILEAHRDDLLPLEATLLDYVRAGSKWVLSRDPEHKKQQYRLSQEAAEIAPGTMWSFDAGQDAMQLNRTTEALEYFSQLDPESVLVREWKGYRNQFIRTSLSDGRFQEVLALINTSIEKYYPEVWYFLQAKVQAHAAIGEVDSIRACFQISTRLEPTSVYSPGSLMRTAANHLCRFGHQERIQPLLDLAIDWHENQDGNYLYDIARTRYNMGAWEEARRIFEQLASENPDDYNYKGYLGTLAARRPDRHLAEQTSTELEAVQVPPENIRSFTSVFRIQLMWRARIAALLGEKDQALSLLEEYNQTTTPYSVASLAWNQDLESLWDHPRFVELVSPKR
ncbi:protein kinase [Gemmatimonadota bacterium]